MTRTCNICAAARADTPLNILTYPALMATPH